MPGIGSERGKNVFHSDIGTEGQRPDKEGFCPCFPWRPWKEPASQLASYPSGAHLIKENMIAHCGMWQEAQFP